MKTLTNFFFIGLILLASCSGNATKETAEASDTGIAREETSIDVQQAESKAAKSELPSILTADVVFVNTNDQVVPFVGYQKKGAYFDEHKTVCGSILANNFLTLHFEDTDRNVIALSVHSESGIKTGTYDLNTYEGQLTLAYVSDGSTYSGMAIHKLMDNTYEGKPAKPFGTLVIEELTDNRIKGAFNYDAYNRDFSKKIEFRNGKFEGAILWYND